MNIERIQKIETVLNSSQPDLTVLMENVSNLHNLSAILRTCDAVGIHEAHAVHETGTLPTFRRTARGSQKWVELHVHETATRAIEQLREQGLQIYGTHLSRKSIDYLEIDWTKPSAIVVGDEKSGMSDLAAEAVDEHIKVSMAGMVQSLNVSAATAIILFEARRQRIKSGMYDQRRISERRYEELFARWSLTSQTGKLE